MILYEWKDERTSLTISLEGDSIRIDANDGFHDSFLMLPVEQLGIMAAALIHKPSNNPLVVYFKSEKDKEAFLNAMAEANKAAKSKPT